MKYLLFILPTLLLAPYDADFYVRSKLTHRAFYFREKKDGSILRLYVKNYLEDTFHVQPERSKREDSPKCEMRCSEHYGNIVRDK